MSSIFAQQRARVVAVSGHGCLINARHEPAAQPSERAMSSELLSRSISSPAAAAPELAEADLFVSGPTRSPSCPLTLARTMSSRAAGLHFDMARLQRSASGLSGLDEPASRAASGLQASYSGRTSWSSDLPRSDTRDGASEPLYEAPSLALALQSAAPGAGDAAAAPAAACVDAFNLDSQSQFGSQCLDDSRLPFLFDQAVSMHPSDYSELSGQGFGSGLLSHWPSAAPPRLSPLHAAASDANPQALLACLRAGSRDANAWSDVGTPLHCAVHSNSAECAGLLVAAGADIDATNGDGITPLMQAAAMGHEEVLLRLLSLGASITAAVLPGSSENLLHFCVENDMLQALQALLRHPEGRSLAVSSRMKPIYVVLNAMDQRRASHDVDRVPPLAADMRKAKSMVDLLLPHSGLRPNASFDEMVAEAQSVYEDCELTRGWSSFDEDRAEAMQSGMMTPLLGSPSPGAGDLDSARMSTARAESGRRFAFTPTANLDCSPAHCSPLSIFNSTDRDCWESRTPSAMSQHGSTMHVSVHTPTSRYDSSSGVHTCSPIAACDKPPTLAPAAGGLLSPAASDSSPAMHQLNLRVRTRRL